MIPFASQRALGQDLATHLLNAHDNEMVELAGMRGAVADDLHGAFAEWEAQAHALTKCQNYLYNLSINPDPAQGTISREQYLDYIGRTEESLGLTGQPRAVVFHTKYGREHCHVVWSRIDLEQEKAIQLAFDHQKLMMVTRDFARDHHLELPKGYFNGGDRKSQQRSLYEMHQQRATGLSKEDHQKQVTDAWRSSDSPKALVHALSECGYILATGKRPYVLVDLYGGMHALPKLIADKSVRSRDIRAFLEKEFPPESLPNVEEARTLVAQHRQALDDHTKADQRAEKLAQLKNVQAVRRGELEKNQSILRQKQHRNRLVLAVTHKAERNNRRKTYLREVRRTNEVRASQQRSGLSSFFGRISGIHFLRKHLRKYHDLKRAKEFLVSKQRLNEKQVREQLALKRHQEMQTLNMRRKVRALGKIEKRELRSLEESLRKDRREQGRGGRTQMPALSLGMTDQVRQSPPLVRDRFMESGMGEREDAPTVRDGFVSASGNSKKQGSEKKTESRKPVTRSGIRRYSRKKSRDTDKDRGR